MNYLINNQLYHHGILGMKWGIRRYQNPDGSLTTEGRLRYRKDSKGRLVKLSRKERKQIKKEQKRKAAEEAEKKKPLREKNVKDMSDDELREYINRMNQEKMAYQLKADISRLNPRKVSVGEKLAKEFFEKTILPAATEVGKQYLTKAIKEAAGLNTKQEVSKEQKAKNDSQYWQNLSNIENNKANYYRTKSLNDEYERTKDIKVYKKK